MRVLAGRGAGAEQFTERATEVGRGNGGEVGLRGRVLQVGHPQVAGGAGPLEQAAREPAVSQLVDLAALRDLPPAPPG